jgi:hypothetical protein
MSSQPVVEPASSRTPQVDWRAEGARALRTLAAATAAGVASGIVVGGIGGRLAMGLLAAQNPEDHGRLTDDGFVMGQFTVSGTINLIGATYFLGLFAALVYLALRGLLIGPLWFQVASMALGAGVVVGALLVSPDGVDFTLLDPPLLPIALFVAIPVLCVAMLASLAHWFLRPHSWWATGDLRLVVGLTAVLWIVGFALLPAVVVLAVVWALWLRLRSTAVAAVFRSPTTQWVARALLAAVFGVALVSLSSDLQTLM